MISGLNELSICNIFINDLFRKKNVNHSYCDHEAYFLLSFFIPKLSSWGFFTNKK